MASTYTDKLTRLGNKLDSITTKLDELTEQRDQILAEINSIATGTAATKTPTGPKRGNLGQRIMTYLQANPGQDVSTIANKMKVMTNQAALSLYHLGNKKYVTQTDNKYYVVAPAKDSDTEVAS